jgi:hypothetical protein
MKKQRKPVKSSTAAVNSMEGVLFKFSKDFNGISVVRGESGNNQHNQLQQEDQMSASSAADRRRSSRPRRAPRDNSSTAPGSSSASYDLLTYNPDNNSTSNPNPANNISAGGSKRIPGLKKQVPGMRRRDHYHHESSFTFCQSCNNPCRRIRRIRVNNHHHINPFYSQFAIYAQLGSGSPYLQNNGWNGQVAYETVSAKPTTAAIPIEKVSLCEVCAGLFLTHRLHCDTCNYIPRLDERHMRDCTKCFDGVICKT